MSSNFGMIIFPSDKDEIICNSVFELLIFKYDSKTNSNPFLLA